MSRDDAQRLYPGFPGDDADAHLRTIPACAALGMRQAAAHGAPVETMLDAALPAVRDADGRVDRGAALVLADQATAGGVFASLTAPTPMMTLDLRVDWLAPCRVARSCVVSTMSCARERSRWSARGCSTARSRSARRSRAI